MRVLVCGSLAYDSIMLFKDRFVKHILPDKTHTLNVSFLASELRIEYGGCAGNVAWNLKMLGGHPVIMATAGKDFARYKQRLEQHGQETSCIRTIEDAYTAQAFITTDLDNNQIISFHPGAMEFSSQIRVDEAGNVGMAIIGPDSYHGIMEHVSQCYRANIDCIFDPGQGITMFSGADLIALVSKASYLTLNAYEADIMQQRTGQTLKQLAQGLKGLIVTLGDKGSRIYADGTTHEIPVVQPKAVVDPTGCGDAYRAGLIFGITNGFDWPTTGRLASLLGAIKVASPGGQNHRFDSSEIARLFERHFNNALQ